MDGFLGKLQELVGWNPRRVRYLRRLFEEEASHGAGDPVTWMRWVLQISGLAGEVIEVHEANEYDGCRSVPEALRRARPWSMIRIVTDFDDLDQPAWIINKPVWIENDGNDRHQHPFFNQNNSICFVHGCGRASLHGFVIHGADSCPAIHCSGCQPWIEECVIYSTMEINVSSSSTPYFQRCSFHYAHHRWSFTQATEAESAESSEGEESSNEPRSASFMWILL